MMDVNRVTRRSRRMLALLVALTCVSFWSIAGVSAAEEAASPLKQGDRVTIDGRRGTVSVLDMLPYVQSEYSKRFTFDSYDNPKLKELRERYRLDEVVAPGKSEFDRQVLLLDWVNHRFKKFGRPSSLGGGALKVLEAGGVGDSVFFFGF